MSESLEKNRRGVLKGTCRPLSLVREIFVREIEIMPEDEFRIVQQYVEARLLRMRDERIRELLSNLAPNFSEFFRCAHSFRKAKDKDNPFRTSCSFRYTTLALDLYIELYLLYHACGWSMRAVGPSAGTGMASTSARKIAHEMELSLYEWGEGEEEWFGRPWIPRIRPLYYREFKDENVVDIYAVLDWMSFSPVSPQVYASSLYNFDDSSLIIPTFVLLSEIKGH